MNNKLQEYNSLNLTEFNYIEKITYERSSGDGKDYAMLNLSITLNKGDTNEKKLYFYFSNVSHLKINHEESYMFQIEYLKIESTKELGWEKVKYKVKEVYDESISFMCEDFEFHVE